MASIYFNKISVVDHTRILPNGQSRGGSYNFNFVASLPSTRMSEEQVVVDFSSGKKDVKKIIDQHVFDPRENGWDHKTWVPTKCNDIRWVQIDEQAGCVDTPYLYLEAPLDSFRFLDSDVSDGMFATNEIRGEMQDFVQETLAPQADGVKYEVTLDEDPYPHVIHHAMAKATALFRYEHGLRHSTSYGCKNILHGHLSYVHVGHEDQQIASAIALIVADMLDNSYVYHQGILQDGWFSYENSRGRFGLRFKQPKKFIALGTEPTIENIFDYVVEGLKTAHPAWMKELTFLEVSEGLQKGACCFFLKD
jgi:hypothetical protein